jgi:prepilin-type N-terminal cleavage/methylation domain-containing protein
MFTYFSRMRNKKGFTLVELIVVIAIIGIMSAVAVPNMVQNNRRAQANRHNQQARTFYLAVHQTLTNLMQNDNSENEFGIILSGTTNTRRISGEDPLVDINIRPLVTPIANHRYFFLYVEIGPNGRATYADLMFGTAANYNTWTLSPTSIATNAIATMNYSTTPRPAVFRCAPCTATPCNSCKSGFRRPLTHNNRTLDRLIDEIEGYSDLSNQPGFYYVMFDPQFRVIMAYYSEHGDRLRTRNTLGGPFQFNDNNRISIFTFGAYPRQYGFVGTIGTDPTRGGAPAPHNDRTNTQNWFTNIIPEL